MSFQIFSLDFITAHVLHFKEGSTLSVIIFSTGQVRQINIRYEAAFIYQFCIT